MPLDGLMLKGVTYELNSNFTGGIIDKITQPLKDQIILTIRNNGKNFKLLISSSSDASRIHITNNSKINPMNAPLFCMMLRKHISRGKILKIEQVDYERIIKIHIESRDELGDTIEKILIAELMGKNSNIILVNNKTGTIMDSIKHVDFQISRVREIMPGRHYELPPQTSRYSIESLDNKIFKDLLNNNSDSQLSKFLINNFQGMSNFIASEICSCYNLNPKTQVKDLCKLDIENLLFALLEIKNTMISQTFKGYILKNGSNPWEFSFKFLPSQKENFDSLNDTLESFYNIKEQQSTLSNKKTHALKTIRDILHRLQKKISIHESTINSSKDYDIYRAYGDIINCNLYILKLGLKVFKAQNFYDPELKEISIPLDENLTPSENSQKHYKKYNKFKKAFEFSTDMLKTLKNEEYYLESQMSNIENAESAIEIEDILSELIKENYIKTKTNSKDKPKKHTEQSKPHHFISSNGFDIFVGKNNNQNDYLTLKFADKNDIWLHIKKIPGSHVIIKCSDKKVDETTIYEAAILGAYYSKARLSSNVPIDYTERKNVKKPSGSKPGMVIYETNNTMYVTPSEELINKIKKIE